MFTEGGKNKGDAMQADPVGRKPAPPLFIGCLQIHHNGCWASDVTDELRYLSMDLFVFEVFVNGYSLYAVVRPLKKDLFSEEEINRFMTKVNRHSLVVDFEDILLSPTLLIVRIKVRDYGRVEGAIRPVRMFGLTRFEIGHHVEEGEEYVYGLFSSKDDFEKCRAAMQTTYPNQFKYDKSFLADTPGLTVDVPLFSEAIMLGERFPELREILNTWLIHGTESYPDNWILMIISWLLGIRDKFKITPEQVKGFGKEVGKGIIIAGVTRVLKEAARFIINHYLSYDIGDP